MLKTLTLATLATFPLISASNAATFQDAVWRKNASGYQIACTTVTTRHGVIVHAELTTPWLATFATKAAAKRATRNIDCE